MQSLIEFKKFVDEVQQNNSRNYKLEVLKKYKENENIKRYLDFIYNPYKITGISEGKLYKEVSMVVQGVTSMYELMDYLLAHNTGKDEDIAVIQQYKDTLDIDYYEIFDSVVTKSLSLGVDTLSINKCMGDLIPVFNVQLANKYFDKPEVVEGKSFALTTKIDGGRIIAIKENGKVTFYTRQGQVYEGLVDLEQEMLENRPFDFMDQDPKPIAKAIVRLVAEAFGQSDEFKLFVTQKQLGEIADIPLMIESRGEQNEK